MKSSELLTIFDLQHAGDDTDSMSKEKFREIMANTGLVISKDQTLLDCLFDVFDILYSCCSSRDHPYNLLSHPSPPLSSLSHPAHPSRRSPRSHFMVDLTSSRFGFEWYCGEKRIVNGFNNPP